MFVAAVAAKPFFGEPDWVASLQQTGLLLIGVGLAIDFASRKSGQAAYRAALGFALCSVLLLGWANGAVGIIGSEDNRANLMYGGVVLVGFLGACVARFKPKGMARALFASAVAQTLVTGVALVGQMGEPYTGPVELLTINGFFVALFVGSAVLFSKAESARPDGVAA
jgi:hypothetical protein